MISKTAIIEQYLLERIHSGTYLPHSRLPSQKQLMWKFGCSRVTVLRALRRLELRGLLYGQRGRGTFTRLLPQSSSREITEIVVIGDYLENSPIYPFSEMLFQVDIGERPLRLLNIRDLQRSLETFFHAGQAVLWLLPRESQFVYMQYLKDKGLPQLLINRNYGEFDHICTEPLSGMTEGVRWLSRQAGGNLALLCHSPGGKRPYQADRLIAFYEACFALGLRLLPENNLRYDANAPQAVFDQLVKRISISDSHPLGILVMDHELSMPFIFQATKSGLALGRDYFILTIDQCIPGLPQKAGAAILEQSMSGFRNSIEAWLQHITVSDKPFARHPPLLLRIQA